MPKKQKEEESDISDLDALMSSLAGDDVDSLDNSDQIDNLMDQAFDKVSGAKEEVIRQDRNAHGVASADSAEKNTRKVSSKAAKATKEEDTEAEEKNFFEGLNEDGAPEELPDGDIDEAGLNGAETEEEEKASGEETEESDLLSDALSDHIEEAEMEEEDEESQIPERPSRKKGRKGKKNGSSDENDNPDDDQKGKKKGFFAKLFSSLFEPLEGGEEEGEPVENSELASLTEENQQVLDELSKEGKKGAPAPGGKKKKEKKEKKPKEAKPKKAAKPKPKKAAKPKPKKEKKPVNPADSKPLKRIAPKKIIVAFMFAITLGVMMVIPSMILPQRALLSEAEGAYASGDYWTAYKDLYGQTGLSSSDQAIYEKARTISRMKYFYNSYTNYTKMNMSVEALDSLLKGISLYPEIQKSAQATGDNVVENEVNKAYDNIKSALTETYGISLDDAYQILAIEDDSEYTTRLQQIAGTK